MQRPPCYGDLAVHRGSPSDKGPPRRGGHAESLSRSKLERLSVVRARRVLTGLCPSSCGVGFVHLRDQAGANALNRCAAGAVKAVSAGTLRDAP